MGNHFGVSDWSGLLMFLKALFYSVKNRTFML